MSSKHYLVFGHTAKGFCNLLHTNLQGLNTLYILKGGPTQCRTAMMNNISSGPALIKHSREYLHSPSDPDSLDGILFPELGVGIVDGATPDRIEPTSSEAHVENIDLGACMDQDKLSDYTDVIRELQDKIQECCKNAYDAFAKGIIVHDEWEKIYIGNMNFVKADHITEVISYELLGDAFLDKVSSVKHRFFGGSTPSGPIDYVEDLTKDVSARYFIKGRPGSGKSTMLKRLLKCAEDRGIDAEVYHCGFDPDSLDMLLFPELSLCIFDSTPPHEYYPSRSGDSLIDMYEESINPGTDEAYEAELADIASRYKSYTREGTDYLAEAKHYRDILENLYLGAADLTAIDQLQEELYHKITAGLI